MQDLREGTADGAERAGAPAGLDPLSEDAGAGGDARAGVRGLGLSAKLLLLAVVFVMIAEVLIFLPSVANFRVNWLNDRITAARLASLATESAPDGQVPPALRMALLSLAQVKAVAIKRDNRRSLVLAPEEPISVDSEFDLRAPEQSNTLERLMFRLGLIGDALAVYVTPVDQMVRIRAKPETDMDPHDPSMEYVEIVIPNRTLYDAMLRYGLNILVLSIIISMIAAALLYFALDRLLVNPILKITANMVRFSARPEDQSRIIEPSGRTDEIGVAERELAHMQTELSQTLQQKSRLAQLGLAVSKINHDLRNMLASAQLISDRLGTVKDPTVQRFAPKLIASLDRAIQFCNDTMRYGRAEEAAPRRERVLLAPLVAEVGEGLGLPRERIAWQIDIDPDLRIDADRHQLYRIMNNLARNALQAIEASESPHGRIEIAARRDGAVVRVRFSDDGPGLPPRAKANLFQAFQGSARKGGTGLGLAIVAELIAAHGGTIRLVEAGRGATFEIELPDRDAGREADRPADRPD